MLLAAEEIEATAGEHAVALHMMYYNSSASISLRTFVCDRLAEGWAPEQIAGWLKAGNERGLRALGFEASTPSSIASPTRAGTSGAI
jgi:hypothetical protein